MIYHCCDPRRRELVLDHPTLNGIDFVEVLDGDAPFPTPRQRTLLIRFLKPAPDLTVDNIEILGGERVTGIGASWITRADAPDLALIDPIEDELPDLLTGLREPEHVLALRTDSSGDYSIYTLRLLSGPAAISPPAGVDRVLSEVDFSFKVECPTDFDCAPTHDCPTELTPAPNLSYLAKDYQSFRRLMLNRIAQLSPDWRERNPADLGVTLVEMLAYTADRLSYAQDAAATESYLHTARRRSSVRRHARLVDYAMHDGANARTWVHIEAVDGVAELAGATVRPDDTSFYTRLIGVRPTTGAEEFDEVVRRTPEFFEPLHELRLFSDHNSLDFYDWGDEECCLPVGSTRATLAGDHPNLAVGDVLVLEEVLGPRTGLDADADPAHRHAVRLCAVQAGLIDELTDEPITEIRWEGDDALPFALCVSSRLDESVGGGLATRVSRALGNIVLADHGRSISDEDIGAVPQPHLQLVPTGSGDPCDRPEPLTVPPRFVPSLAERPVTQAVPFDSITGILSARSASNPDDSRRRPVVSLSSETAVGVRGWAARRDLLGSSSGDTHFVVETETNGLTKLRFGDDRNGLRPPPGAEFTAAYRVGNGVRGNVGADSVRHAMSLSGDLSSTIVSVRNPLAAIGGLDPETIDEVRQAAPYAYRRQERAVTPGDYADVARRHPDVQRAAATFRWNGHGHTVFITVDRFGGRPVTPEFETDLRAFVEPFRMAGYDLEIDAPRFVSIELRLFVCAAADHFRSQVREEVLRALSATSDNRGLLGHFHPDNFTFGGSVYLSTITARVMEIEGVTSVTANVFRRRGRPDPVPLIDGVIDIGRLEIARLDNDPNFPERGSLEVEMGGGK